VYQTREEEAQDKVQEESVTSFQKEEEEIKNN
jgi:hypothetical protein